LRLVLLIPLQLVAAAVEQQTVLIQFFLPLHLLVVGREPHRVVLVEEVFRALVAREPLTKDMPVVAAMVLVLVVAAALVLLGLMELAGYLETAVLE
jgi:hypothetical protein